MSLDKLKNRLGWRQRGVVFLRLRERDIVTDSILTLEGKWRADTLKAALTKDFIRLGMSW
jgi:hypothetical protein